MKQIEALLFDVGITYVFHVNLNFILIEELKIHDMSFFFLKVISSAMAELAEASFIGLDRWKSVFVTCTEI